MGSQHKVSFVELRGSMGNASLQLLVNQLMNFQTRLNLHVHETHNLYNNFSQLFNASENLENWNTKKSRTNCMYADTRHAFNVSHRKQPKTTTSEDHRKRCRRSRGESTKMHTKPYDRRSLKKEDHRLRLQVTKSPP